MNKIVMLIITLMLPLLLSAKKSAVYETATKACPAYNNMKHTTNTNDIVLEKGKSYRILSQKDGQILTLVEGERIAQRWVDASCFSSDSESKQRGLSLSSIVSSIGDKLSSATKAKSRQNLLALSWQNAFCQTHQYKKECKAMRRGDYAASHFVLHGLWPQPRNNQYCHVSKREVGMDKNRQWNRLPDLDLNTTIRAALAEKMPGYKSNLHKHEWVKHGSCYGKSPNAYYDDALKLLSQLNHSKIQQFFAKNMGKKVTLKEIRRLFDETFGEGTGKHVTMNCQQGLITELWLHLGSNQPTLAELLLRGDTPKSRCFSGRIDAVGY